MAHVEGAGWLDSDEQAVRETTFGAVPKFKDVTFPMSSSDAQNFIKWPGVLLIGKLESPFYLSGGNDVSGATPTRSNPIERQITVDGILLRLAEIWYYNTTTGQVYYREHISRSR